MLKDPRYAKIQLLSLKIRVNPAADENNAIRWASQNGHLEVVKILLQDPRVDPGIFQNWLLYDKIGRGAKDNNPIRVASQMGHLEIVKLLMKDPRVDPSALDCRGFR